MKSHILIAGPGRAGTTFLVELFTHLGFDTGYSKETIKDHKHFPGNAGLEWDIFDPNAPYVVKSPFLFERMDEVLNTFSIDHVFIPLRDLYSMAESRRRVDKAGSVFGGLVGTTSHELGVQEQILAEQVYSLFYSLSKSLVPFTLLEFPRHAIDSEYSYRKLYKILMLSSTYSGREAFKRVFDKISDPGLIHSFTAE